MQTHLGQRTMRHATIVRSPCSRMALRPVSALMVAQQESQAPSPGAAGVLQGTWRWRGHNIRYQRSGEEGPAILLVHGFGGNCDHWRKNTPVLSGRHRVFAIDLLGYGYSDKPSPRNGVANAIYNFENWGEQLADFISAVVGEPAFVVCNSVGGLSGLQASIASPHLVRGLQLQNISLRGLNVRRMSPLQRPLVAWFQRVLRETDLGRQFFGNVARPKTVKNILQQAYANKAAVTDELVDAILKPGLQPGAVDVFLDFISYSGGPLPEELLAVTTVPVSIVWGQADPWESVVEAKKLFTQPSITEFIVLPGVGHCPMDEAPDLVNPLIEKFVAAHCNSPMTPVTRT